MTLPQLTRQVGRRSLRDTRKRSPRCLSKLVQYERQAGLTCMDSHQAYIDRDRWLLHLWQSCAREGGLMVSDGDPIGTEILSVVFDARQGVSVEANN